MKLMSAPFAILLLASASQTSAQSLPALGQGDDDWRQSVSVFLFAPLAVQGTSTVAGQSAEIDLGLSDVLDLLEFVAIGRYEAWNGDFGVIVDANYVGLEADATLAGPLGSKVNVDFRQRWLGVMAGYRLANGTYGARGERYTFDLQGGARYNSIRQQINITTPGPGNLPVLGGDESWIEPVIAARGMWRLNDKWTTIASLELGGFGAGGNDLQIGANVGFDYQPWENAAITVGYRYFSVDYSDTLTSGTFAYDASQHGPYVGFKYYFD
ncbi:MAG: outer membrane protein [Roseobacter sp.]